jgi:hypothetical protein
MKIRDNIEVKLKCVFCDAILQVDENQEFQSGDTIQCSNCEEYNDYDSLIEIAQNEAVSEISKDIEKSIQETFKKFT